MGGNATELNLLEAAWNSYTKALGKDREIYRKDTGEGRKTRSLMYEERLAYPEHYSRVFLKRRGGENKGNLKSARTRGFPLNLNLNPREFLAQEARTV